MKIMNNAGNTMVTGGSAQESGQKVRSPGRRRARLRPSRSRGTAAATCARARWRSFRGGRGDAAPSVAALKAMVELLIEKGVFSREEYLSRV